jgi:hypothetical protein
LIVVTAACGGGESASNTPKLNPAVASRLASASDAIAESLDRNDVCTAAGQADDLLDAIVQAIAAGEIPPAFQEELTGRANELVNEVNCPPPPKQEEDEDHNEGKDKNKNRGKGNGNGQGNQQTTSDTTQTDTVTTDNSGPGG